MDADILRPKLVQKNQLQMHLLKYILIQHIIFAVYKMREIFCVI